MHNEEANKKLSKDIGKLILHGSTPDATGVTNFPGGPCILDEEIWCEEGCRRLRITTVHNDKNEVIGLKFETIDTTNGWHDQEIVDTVTIANFRLKYIRDLIDKTLEKYEEQKKA